MPIDFPNSPFDGQDYNGYVWDGEKWIVSDDSALSGFVMNDASSVVGNPQKYFQSSYYGNQADGITHRMNRILVGIAAHASGNVEAAPDPGVWTDLYFQTSANLSQVSSISAIGNLGVSGFSRTSDYRAWSGGVSGGSQGVNGFAVNDDLTISTSPIACAVFGQGVHLNSCNGITLNQFDVENRGPIVDASPFGGVSSGSTFGVGVTPGLHAAVNHATAGIYVGAGLSTKYRKGMIFFADSLDQSVGVGGTGVALEHASGQSQRWAGPEATVTVSIGSPSSVGWAAHGRLEGSPFQFRVGGATNPNDGFLPTGAVVGKTYYVKSPTTDAFNFSATPGGAAINTTGTLSGVFHAYATYAEVWGDALGLHLQTDKQILIGMGGSAAAPKVAFSPDTGIYSPSDGYIDLVSKGIMGLRVNYGGSISIGTADGSHRLNVAQTDPNSSLISYIGQFMHLTYIAPTAGIGTGINLSTQTDLGGNVEIGGSIASVATDVTAASEDFDLVFKVMAAGAPAAEKFRIRSTGAPIFKPTVGPETLSVNGEVTVELASNTSLRFRARGSDGVTRTASLTLA